MAMTRKYLPIVTAILAVLGISAVAATAGGDSSNPPGNGVPQVEAIEAEAEQAMTVLRAPRDAVDALPADVSERMDAHADFGMNPALSRLAIGNATNSLYVIPASGHVCASLTVGEGANVACPTTPDIADGKVGPATVTLVTGGIGIYGLVPDGVDSVSVQTDGSEPEEVATEDNAYFAVVPAGTPLESVSYTGPSGAVEFPIYDPRSVLD